MSDGRSKDYVAELSFSAQLVPEPLANDVFLHRRNDDFTLKFELV